MKYEQPSLEKSRFTCPHCNALAVFSHERLVEKIASVVEDYFTNDFGDDNIPGQFCKLIETAKRYYGKVTVSLCQCEKPRGLVWVNGKLLYPLANLAPPAADDMPPDVRTIYNEAAKVSGISPRAVAALLRLALDLLLRHIWDTLPISEADKAQKEAKLGRRVEILGKAHAILPATRDMAEALQLVGNEAAHVPGMIQPAEKPETAKRLFVFVNLLVEQLITQPKIGKEEKDTAAKRRAERKKSKRPDA